MDDALSFSRHLIAGEGMTRLEAEVLDGWLLLGKSELFSLVFARLLFDTPNHDRGKSMVNFSRPCLNHYRPATSSD